MHDFSIVAIFKGEGRHLIEWIEYHALLRADHFYLYTNWAVSSGLAHITWVAQTSATAAARKQAGDADWKSGPFQVTEAEAKHYVKKAWNAMRAGAGCHGAAMPPGAEHWTLNTGLATKNNTLRPVVRPGGELEAGNPPYAKCNGGYLKQPCID